LFRSHRLYDYLYLLRNTLGIEGRPPLTWRPMCTRRIAPRCTTGSARTGAAADG